MNKHIRPSLDYRFVSDRNREGNFELRHRLNANLQFSYDIDQLELDFRLRYQYARTRFVDDIEPEFGAALRYKTSFAYDIKNLNLLNNSGIITCILFQYLSNSSLLINSLFFINSIYTPC
jgi:hypothetical protein